MKINKTILTTLILLLILFFGCKKNNILTSSIYDINISTDTVLFDTLFTTIGSTTKRIKCYNNNNGIINISQINLQNGEDSPFRINVDGESGIVFKDLSILPGDSIFIFIEVTIDPNGSNLPLIVEDEIIFETNNNLNRVVLNAWGQDAYYHVNEIVQGIWSNDKPHVIYGVAAVGYPNIDSNLNLTIESGTKIHGHSNAVLFIYKSSLNVNGNISSLLFSNKIEQKIIYFTLLTLFLVSGEVFIFLAL